MHARASVRGERGRVAVGTKQVCSLCKGEREERKDELAELQVESELPP